MKKFNQYEVMSALAVMARMQDDLNKTVHAAWQKQDFRWDRAIWIEMAEWMDHVGWKWWKRQDINVEQAKLEAVDIFHFLLSHSIRSGHLATLARFCIENLDNNWDVFSKVDDAEEPNALRNFFAETENLVSKLTKTVDVTDGTHKRAVMTEAIDIGELCSWIFSQMTFAELYYWYVGKNTLNFFRQANGYKAGTYRKVNGGREDNVVLAEAIADASSGNYCDDLSAAPSFVEQRLRGWYKLDATPEVRNDAAE